MLTARHSRLTPRGRGEIRGVEEGTFPSVRGVGAPEPLEGLRALVELRSELDEIEGRRVQEAVRQGRSWAQVAAALGVSKQAAHKRHARRVREAEQRRPQPAQRRLLVTGQARRAVGLAREEAGRLGSEEAGPEHLLLGLLLDDHGTALRALESAGVRLERARRLVGDAGPHGPVDNGGRARVSAQARAVLEQSLREAVHLHDSHLGVEHLLLALLKDREGAAGRVLAELGAPPQEVAERVLALIGPAP
jgi:hypothetical protein